ncbi:hypothetical protein Ciccas_004404 [Cichlidogyrus casuarinus]|uniref:Enhancer of rudimentary homolog n=1 Tax=Cichlidogyrus casuarinus TaxID=1844966 RepID=A0ABD2QBQ1_9PLAT
MVVKSHTILLVQPTANKPGSRTWSEYETLEECLEGICKIYEEHLKKQNSRAPKITYDLQQLFQFLDQLADITCMVLHDETLTYVPHTKAWIKENIYAMLKRQANAH